MKGKNIKKKKYQNIGLLYISPWIIGFLGLWLYPLVSSVYFSFTQYNILKPPRWVGLQNYVGLITSDPDFGLSVWATLKYVGISLPLRLLASLAVALILNQRLKGISFFRAAYYVPSLLGGSVAVAVVWRYIFALNGVVNGVLGIFGVEAVNWLGSPSFAIITISLLNVWQFGGSMIIFLAGLKDIPLEYYEAARIEGCGKLMSFWKITLPLLYQVIMYNLIMELIRSFQDFTAAFLITEGGPMKSTYLYALKLYNDAFTNFRIGYASAESVLLFLLLIILTIIIFKVGGLWSFYTGGED